MDSTLRRLVTICCHAGQAVPLGFLRSIGGIVGISTGGSRSRTDELELIEAVTLLIDIDGSKRIGIGPVDEIMRRSIGSDERERRDVRGREYRNRCIEIVLAVVGVGHLEIEFDVLTHECLIRCIPYIMCRDVQSLRSQTFVIVGKDSGRRQDDSVLVNRIELTVVNGGNQYSFTVGLNWWR